jgi:hypothetical protein
VYSQSSNDSPFAEKGRAPRKLVAASGITIRKNAGEEFSTADEIHFKDIKSTQRYQKFTIQHVAIVARLLSHNAFMKHGGRSESLRVHLCCIFPSIHQQLESVTGKRTLDHILKSQVIIAKKSTRN